jgi:protein-disulfide isomerase
VKTALPLFLILAFGTITHSVRAQQAQPATAGTPTAATSSTQTTSSTQKTIEAYLRHLYAFGPDAQIVVGPPKPTPVEGMLETNIGLTINGNKQTVKFYVSKDGKFLFQGELSDMTKDPLAQNRAQIQMNDAPSLGDPKALVTLVEYSDFECPVCRNLHDALRGLLPNYAGKVRVVFKDFPLEQIHPWARTAAIAGRCAYQQDARAFWKMYDFIYDNQEIISAATAWTKMMDYAAQSGLDADAFKTCMASPEASAAVNASRANGQLLDVTSTPTVFVNGRRIVGADAHLLEQYINYELGQQQSSPKTTDKK